LADTRTKRIAWTKLRKPVSFASRDVAIKGVSGMADDWLWSARKRLAAASGVMGVIWLIYLIVVNYFSIWTSSTIKGMFEVVNVLGSMVVAVSLLMIFLTRIKRLNSQRVMDVGLLYFVFCSWAIAVSETCKDWTFFTVIWGVSWVCLWIAVFPLVVPTSPIKMFLASFVSASVGPLAFFLAAKAGNPIPDPPIVVYLMYLPNYIAVGVAVYFSHVVYEFERDLSEARRIGSYHLTKIIGRGGMGEVWHGKHQMLARPAAIKLVAPDNLGTMAPEIREGTFQRFEREAKATAALHSPHTINIYDFGINEDGIFYYVMEYLEGPDLATFVKKFGRVPGPRLLFWLRQIAHSLAEAHQSGLIHRDIKPANIILCRKGLDFDVIKVLDFGLVKSMGQVDEVEEELTLQGQIFGTAGFMAPEAVMGRNDLVDTRSDIYSVGCVLYRLLTGRQVFMGKTPMEIILSHVGKEPIPPSNFMTQPLDAELERLVLDCLAKEPDKRPRDGLELQQRVRAIHMEETWDENAARRWWHENWSGIEAGIQAKSKKPDTDTKVESTDNLDTIAGDATVDGQIRHRLE